MMKFNKIAIFLVLLLVGKFAFGFNQAVLLQNLGEQIVAPYMNTMADPMDLLRMRYGQKGQGDVKNSLLYREDRPDIEETTRYETPLTVGPMIYRSLLWANSNGDSVLRDASIAELRLMLAEFEKKGKWARKAHPPLADGWWSGMDFAVMGLVAQLAFEVTGDKSWTKVRDNLAQKIFAPAAENGSRIMLEGSDYSGKCWYLEYLWEGVSKDNAFFVQNGSLFTLQALWLLAETSNNERYRKWFDCGVRGYLSKAEQFYFPNNRWSFYQLSPTPVIIEPHYMIIEIGLLDSLYKLTGNKDFKKHADRRRGMIGKNFPVSFKKGSNGSNEFLFSRFGAPHPYYIDIYRNTLYLMDDNDLIYFIETPTRGLISKDGCVRGQANPRVVNFNLYADPGARVLINSGKIKTLEGIEFDRLPVARNYSLTASGDATLSKGQIAINPAFNADPDNPGSYLNNRGILSIQLDEPVDVSDGQIFAIQVNTDRASPIRLVAFDEMGNAFARNFPPLIKGRSMVVFSVDGFEGGA